MEPQTGPAGTNQDGHRTWKNVEVRLQVPWALEFEPLDMDPDRIWLLDPFQALLDEIDPSNQHKIF
jgi:hypothetical protein